ncbi:MAG: hypothetical protein K1X88_20730 [Nannocystaceae bacterium]|nr:hypothetical protein [Nannocystaceae bacterium]
MNDETELPKADAELQAYFDGELDAAAAQEVARTLDGDPALRGHLAGMSLMRDLVNRSLEMKALEVPRARFEQIWDEIDRTIERDTRSARAPQAAPASLWARIATALRPFRAPLLAAAGAAAVAIVAVRLSGSPEVNQAPEVASLPEPPAGGPASPDAPAPQGSKVADRTTPAPASEDATLPQPRPADAEIHGIEFGGKTGRISHTGTVTVLYVEEEDDSQKKSERSL